MLQTIDIFSQSLGFKKTVGLYQTRYERNESFIIIDSQSRKITFYGSLALTIKSVIQ